MSEFVHIDLDAEKPASELMRQCGYRDRQQGLNASSNSKDYLEGHSAGRLKRAEDKVRYRELFPLFYNEVE